MCLDRTLSEDALDLQGVVRVDELIVEEGRTKVVAEGWLEREWQGLSDRARAERTRGTTVGLTRINGLTMGHNRGGGKEECGGGGHLLTREVKKNAPPNSARQRRDREGDAEEEGEIR